MELSFLSALFLNGYTNDSVVILDNKGTMIQKEIQPRVYWYHSVALDTESRRAIFLAQSSDGFWIDIYDVDSLTPLKEELYIDWTYIFIDFQYDPSSERIFGITVYESDDKEIIFCVVEISLNGSVKVLLVLPKVTQIPSKGATFDATNQIYYILTMNPTSNEMWAVDMIHLQVLRKYRIFSSDSYFDNLSYYPMNHWIVGLVNRTTFGALDLDSGDFHSYKQLNLVSLGAREQSGGVIDADNGYFYSIFGESNYYTWIQIDMNTMTFKGNSFYNQVQCMVYVPPFDK